MARFKTYTDQHKAKMQKIKIKHEKEEFFKMKRLFRPQGARVRFRSASLQKKKLEEKSREQQSRLDHARGSLTLVSLNIAGDEHEKLYLNEM